MEIVGLKIENFMAMGNNPWLTLKNKGLVLIQGVNTDDSSAKSNGAGKSTIPDALLWSIFGKTARDESGDGIVNHTAKKKTRVICVINDDGTIYSITRHRKHPLHKNRLYLHKWADEASAKAQDYESALEELTQGTDARTQILINNLVGCSSEVFNAAVYAGQDKMPDLPGMTDKNLKELVEEASGIEILQDCLKVARARYQVAKADLGAIQAKVKTQKDSVERHDASLEKLKTRYDDWADEHNQFLDKAKDKIQDLKDVIDLKVTDVDAGIPQEEEIEFKMDIISGQILKSADDAKKKQKLNQVLREKDAEKAKAEASVVVLTKVLNRRQLHLDTIKDKVGAPCGECGKVYHTADLEKAGNASLAALAEAQKELDSAQGKFDAAAAAASSALREYDTFASLMPDVTDLHTEMDKLKRELIPFAKARRELENLRIKLGELEVKLEEDVKEVNPLEGAVEDAEDTNKSMRDILTNMESVEKEMDEGLKMAKAAAHVFGPSGVRAHILDTITPYLNSRTSFYLNELSDGNLSAIWSTIKIGAAGQVLEKFTIAVKSLTGGESFGLLSGGEKRKVRLACAMALQDVVSQRARKPISLFIADEIDHALDDAGLERLMTLLNDKAKEHGTVLVISHNELSDWIRETATVTKDSGFSTITGILNV